MPSRIDLISFGQTKTFASTTKPSLTIEPSSVAMFRSGYTGCMAFAQYLFAFHLLKLFSKGKAVCMCNVSCRLVMTCHNRQQPTCIVRLVNSAFFSSLH